MLLGTLGASLLGNLLEGKGTVRAGEGAIRVSEAQLEQVRVFNATPSFKKFWST